MTKKKRSTLIDFIVHFKLNILLLFHWMNWFLSFCSFYYLFSLCFYIHYTCHSNSNGKKWVVLFSTPFCDVCSWMCAEWNNWTTKKEKWNGIELLSYSFYLAFRWVFDVCDIQDNRRTFIRVYKGNECSVARLKI